MAFRRKAEDGPPNSRRKTFFYIALFKAHAAGNSELFTQDEIDAAADAVLADFEGLDGCKLYSLTFAGDEKCLAERGYVSEFGEYTDCIVFDSVFRSPLFGGGAWNAHELYYWQWYVGRSPDGTWRVVTKGYA